MDLLLTFDQGEVVEEEGHLPEEGEAVVVLPLPDQEEGAAEEAAFPLQ